MSTREAACWALHLVTLMVRNQLLRLCEPHMLPLSQKQMIPGTVQKSTSQGFGETERDSRWTSALKMLYYKNTRLHYHSCEIWGP